MDFDKQKEKHINRSNYLKEMFVVATNELNIEIVYLYKYMFKTILFSIRMSNEFDLWKYSRKPNCDFYDYLIWKHHLYDPIVQQIKDHYGI